MALECLQTVLPAPGFAPEWPRYRRVHAFAGGRALPRACRLRVDCTWLRDVLHCGYGVWHAIQGPWLLGAVPRHNLSEFQWTIQRQARYLVSTWRRSFFRGGDDLRAVLVYVVIVVMYVFAPVD